MTQLEVEALTSPQALKDLIGMVRAEAASWREPQDYEPRDAVEEAAFLDVVANTLAALSTLPEAPVAGADESLQARVQPWMMSCFGREISNDRVERGDRLLEEVFELLQSGGYDPARVLALRDYVWGREPGEPFQEVGGVMVTLAAYCLAHDLNMHEAGETELARIWTKIDKIRAKQAAKPVGSALPAASLVAPPAREVVRIEHDGFEGTVQGSYITREGKRGVVLQQIGTKVVHVYGEKWLKPAAPTSTGEKP